MAQSKATDPMHPAGKLPPTLTPTGRFAGKPTLPISRSVTVIGSRKDARLQLLSTSVSQHHALIVNANSGPYIRDLASRHHVLVNGIEVKESPLSDGDEIQIGSFSFRFNESPRTQSTGDLRNIKPAPSGAIEVDGEQIPIPIEGKTLLIGRRDTCDIPLLEDSASTCHAIVFEMDGRRYVRDLGSRTGTFVNHKKVRQSELHPGDELTIGDTTMRYASDGVPAEESFAPTHRADLGFHPSEAEEEDHSLEPADINGPVHVEPEALPLADESESHEASLPVMEPAPSGVEALELLQEGPSETEPVELAPMELEAAADEHLISEHAVAGYPSAPPQPGLAAPTFESHEIEPVEAGHNEPAEIPVAEEEPATGALSTGGLATGALATGALANEAPAPAESAPLELSQPLTEPTDSAPPAADEELADMLAMEALSEPVEKPAPAAPARPQAAPPKPKVEAPQPASFAPAPAPAQPQAPKPAKPQAPSRPPVREPHEERSNEDFLADLESLAPAPPSGGARKKNDIAPSIAQPLSADQAAPETHGQPIEEIADASAPDAPQIEHGAELNPSAAARNSLPPGTSHLDLATVGGDQIDLSADPDVSGPADTTALHFESPADRPTPRLSDQIVDPQDDQHAHLVQGDEVGAEEDSEAIDQVLGLLPESADEEGEIAASASPESHAPQSSPPDLNAPAPEAETAPTESNHSAFEPIVSTPEPIEMPSEPIAPEPEAIEISPEPITPAPEQVTPARSFAEKIEDESLTLSSSPEPAGITQPIEGISFEAAELTGTESLEQEVGISPTLAERASDQPVTFGQSPEAPAAPSMELVAPELRSPEPAGSELSTPDLPAPEAPADEIADGESIDAPPVPELPGGKGKARRKRKPRRRKNEVASEPAPVEPNEEQAAPDEAAPLPMGDHGQVPSEPSPEATEEREEPAEQSLTEQRSPALLPADEIVDFDVQGALDRDRAADSAEIEVLAPTAPEPESALPMGQSDPGLQLPLLESDSIEPPGPSDTGFARAVQDFASDESGPLVEEIPQRMEEPAPVLEPAPASEAPPAEAISTPPQMPLLAETPPAVAEATAPIEPEISLVEEATAPAEAALAPVEERAPESAAPIEQVAAGEVGSGEELAPLAELQPSQFPAGASQLDLEPLAPADLHADDQPGDQQFFDLTAAPEVAAAPEQATEISSPEVVSPAESALEASPAPEPSQPQAETAQSPLEPELHLEPGPVPPPAVSPDQGQAPAPAAPGGDAASWGANQDHFFGGMPLKLGPGSQSRPSRAQPEKSSAEPVAPAARAPSAPQPARPAPPKPQPRKPGEAPTRTPPRPVPRTGPTTIANPFADGKRRAINAGDRQVRTAFDGLAYSPVRQADVFGQAQVPGSLTAGFDPSLVNDVFGGAAIRRGLMTPTGAPPVVPPTSQPAQPGEESPEGASRGPNPKRMPATIPEPAPRAKKRRWFGLLGLLMLAILGCVAATAGIYSQIPAGSSVSGTLHFANMDSVTRQERKSIGESLLASMDNSANVRAEFDLDKGVLTLTSAGGASQSDQHRMLGLLQGVYQKNQQRVAEAGGLRDTVSALKSAMQATQSRIDDAQRQIDALKTVMPSASDKKQLESEVSRLESAYNEAVANVARLQAELKQLRARPSPSSQTNAAPKAVSQPAPAPADDSELASAEPVMLHPDPRWKNDPAMHKLMQQQAIQLRRYNAAVAAGLSDDAANLKARLSTLDRAIRDRQADLGGQPLAQAGPKARAPKAHSRAKPPVTIASFSIAAVSKSASSDAASAQQPDANASAIVKKQQELADAEQARDQAEAAFHDAAKRLRDLNDRIDAARASQEKSASLVAERDRQKQSLIQQQKQYELQTQQARSTAYPLEPTAADVTADVQPDPRPTYAMIACGSIIIVAGVLAILLMLKTRAPRRAQEPNPAESLADLPDYPMLPSSRRQPAQSISAPATNLVEV